jgi:HEPN domain-containing protein
MSEIDKEVLLVVGQWVQKAENDLKNASHTLKLGRACPTDTVCFHAQQCVEKYIKALLMLHRIEFSWIHQISTLVGLLPAHLRPDLTSEEQERLTDYATSMRYPGDYEEISLTEARSAVRIARRVRNQIRKWLPKGALWTSQTK